MRVVALDHTDLPHAVKVLLDPSVVREMDRADGLDEDQVPVLRHRAQVAQLLLVEHEGLLAHDVLARLERAAGVGGVQGIRDGDPDGVDVGVGEARVEVGVDAVDSELAPDLLQPLRRTRSPADRDQFESVDV
ncbi:hypothetical protein GCM10009816_05140 [Microbacterium aquimaris]